MTPLLRESVYSARTLAALAESRRQAEARDRAARASATTCGWCGYLTPTHDPRCLEAA